MISGTGGSRPGYTCSNSAQKDKALAHSIKNLLTSAHLKLADSTSARFDVEILLAHVLDSTRSFLYANPELELPQKHIDVFKKLIRQRAQGEPVAYLTGKCEFWSLALQVSPAVLIPRPETELLVETALDKIPPKVDWRIADLGTGSGAIALALASERKSCEIHATEISPAAIQVAQANARQHGLRNIHFHAGSWGNPLKGKFHLIASNPPYIDADDPHLMQGDLRFEPRLALTPGRDGLAAIRELCQQAEAKLVSGGWLLVEHGFEQGAACREALQQAGFGHIETLQDLQGHERVTLGDKG